MTRGTYTLYFHFGKRLLLRKQSRTHNRVCKLRSLDAHSCLSSVIVLFGFES